MVHLYPLSWKSEEGIDVFEEAGVVVFGVGTQDGKVYSWLDLSQSTMSPNDSFTNVLLS